MLTKSQETQLENILNEDMGLTATAMTVGALMTLGIATGALIGKEVGERIGIWAQKQTAKKLKCKSFKDPKQNKICKKKFDIQYHKLMLKEIAKIGSQCRTEKNPAKCNQKVAKAIIKIKKSLSIAEAQLRSIK